MPPIPAADRDVVLIAANPRAGRRSRERQIHALVQELHAHGFEAEIVTELSRAEDLACRLHGAGRLRTLVAAGGDGTLAELLNRTPPGLPLAIFPCGTANLVARYVGITRQIAPFVSLVSRAETVQLDAGRANGRLFLAVCSCGFDAEVVRQMHTSRLGNISKLTYAMPLLRVLRSYAYPAMQVTVGSEPHTEAPIVARWAFVSNLPCYAVGLQPGAGASGEDGQLDLCALERGGVLSAMRYLPALLRGTQHTLPDCTLKRASRFRIETSVPDIPYELDGDPGGILPVEIDILPKRLTLLVPNACIAQS